MEAINVLIKLFLTIGISLVFGFIALKAGFLDLTGFIAAFCVGFIVFFCGGWRWFIVLLSFFLISSFFTKFRYEEKRVQGVAEQKKGKRNWKKVLSNGIIPALFSLLEVVAPNGEIMLHAFLGGVGVACSDTLATEIGLLSKKEARLIINLRKIVPKGTNGGVTLLGFEAGFLGSLIIALISLGLGLVSVFSALLVCLSGFIGCLIDSVLGATLQLRGCLNNNHVNIISICIGSLICLSLLILT